MSFNKHIEFERQRLFHRDRVLEAIAQQANMFKNLGGENGQLDTPAEVNNLTAVVEVKEDGTLVLGDNFSNSWEEKPENCTTELLVEVLKQIETTQEKLYNEKYSA